MSGHFEDDEPVPGDPRSQGAQCWICPHCFDDSHHISDEAGCERHASTGLAGRIVIGPTDT
jgi:hypothetical protein